MDGSDSLDALANILNDVAEKPYDVLVHIRHIQLAQSLEGLEAEALSAREMMTQLLAAGDDVWLPLLEAKEQTVDLDTADGVQELLSLYARAETDYLSIPILQKHIEFIIGRHEHYAPEVMKPDALGELFTTSWTRQALGEVVSKGTIHLTHSHILWDAQRNWELEMLEKVSNSDRPGLVEHVQTLFHTRLRQPHSSKRIYYYLNLSSNPSPAMEDTFQAYSSFTTNYCPPQDYESLLVSASKLRSQSVRNYDRREQWEIKLTQSRNSLDIFNQYIGYERRAKHPDIFVTRGVYERAIAEADKRRFKGEAGAEEALRLFWTGYCDALRILEVGIDVELETYRRAVRSVPGSGEVWARYLRFLERVSGDISEGLESVAAVYDRALEAKMIRADINQLIPVVLARAGYEKRQLEAGSEDEDALPTLIGILESGVELARQASNAIDPTLRLEKSLVTIYESAGLIDSVFDVWKAAAKHSKSSYQVWLNYTEALTKHQKYTEARTIFADVHAKQIDWPEAIWDAWISFEHLHGSLEDIETCMDRIEKAQYQTNARRAKDAEKAAYQAMQAAAEADASEPINSIVGVQGLTSAASGDVAMDVDLPASERGTKRGAEEESAPDLHKKARIEQKPPPLKRFHLPDDVTEDDLRNLFKDCGSIREVKITSLASTLVATVEFVDRDNVPAALTKDKKRVNDQEISVHLAWKSTLYVTNFPEATDDAAIREMFGKYGTIFDVRWPSKKFKNTRRFCYVQFTSLDAAQKSLELHGRELEPNVTLNVFISNPERKKERTDQDANEREVYIAGLSRFTSKADLEKLFATYGPVKDVRIALDDGGHARGYAFVEFEEAKDAQMALGANNHEFKKRRIAVTLADPRVRARHKSELGLSRVTETRNRSVHIRNLPPATQEGLLQQALEKIIPVKRVEVFIDKQEAVVELENPADAGRLLLRTDPIMFGGNELELSESAPSTRPSGRAQQSSEAMFKPRHLGPSRPKAGLGFKKAQPSHPSASSSQTASSGSKQQDDFRKMLVKK
ncbi:hypothetical protein NLJ89_g2871 [Agrocybe chaxingu]|uniref:U4/U6 snRNA-associated-splicing factor PRP24 n=1 Tax=Agrocybe chaxingu TaxID=84603 RepID=A0A9W8MYJ8_9AGAR|nr:hypothetical protein NLJ89_g2871 [Agrocybe chaxingu]